MNIVETICKLEMIFPSSFFDSVEYLPIHLLYEVKIRGPKSSRGEKKNRLNRKNRKKNN
jgi:hypothetical protein